MKDPEETTEKKPYVKPEVIHEMTLDTKACGSPFPEDRGEEPFETI